VNLKNLWQCMNILGINSGRAAPIRIDPENNRPLSDGGAALIQNNRIACATIEERHTRTRYEPGFSKSSLACLKDANLLIEQIDAVGHSTCCDVVWTEENDIIDSLVDAWHDKFSPDKIASHFKGKVFSIDHHESHALMAFSGSGFARALVCVMDGIGNRYDKSNIFNIGSDWWKGTFQRQDYYLCEWVGKRIQIKKIHEEAHHKNEIGLGELYRSVTHYLGWNSYQYAGKTMALASFGNPKNLSGVELIEFESPHNIKVNVCNKHSDPINQIGNIFKTAGYNILEKNKRPANPEQHFFCDVAALMQQQLENALVKTVSALADKYNVQNIAFGGGVALNCVALGKLVEKRPDFALYVPSAPADTGQALGNAIWLSCSSKSPLKKASNIKGISTSALGPKYNNTEVVDSIKIFLKKNKGHKAIQITDRKELVKKVVNKLMLGQIVGLRNGRAEYGPRALGQSSIIADPREQSMHDKLNKIKRRESFRPYAPSILTEYLNEYFEISTESHY